ncbi:very short patch repair endonuclease [Pseudoxanthomonas mexicana]|uniref:very short patch repair endonuclease n=1 Tax=Pseudoxanthomonas mexicana TaxID=128785 RepID=UPI0028A9D84A|nr:very short patch repair endonuclease [Pseudoxanthomonas mexicana]
MASIRGRDTQPELVVRRFLHSLGFRYRLSPRHLPGKPDVVLPKHHAAVFVHGCFWHGHVGCRFATMPATRTEFWMSKIAANRARDHVKEAELRSKGWRVAVVWECALKSDRDAALQRLVTFIRSGMEFEEISGQARR